MDLLGDAFVHVPVKPRRLLVVETTASAFVRIKKILNSINSRTVLEFIFAQASF